MTTQKKAPKATKVTKVASAKKSAKPAKLADRNADRVITKVKDIFRPTSLRGKAYAKLQKGMTWAEARKAGISAATLQKMLELGGLKLSA